MVSGVLALLLLFGPAAAALSYCFSFMFKSPSLCNVAIIISGFLIGMGASIGMFAALDVRIARHGSCQLSPSCFIRPAALILRLLGMNPFDPKDKLVRIAIIIEWIGRFFPTFCLGKGTIYVLVSFS